MSADVPDRVIDLSNVDKAYGAHYAVQDLSFVLEMADRVLVLAAPARLALEVRLTAESRADPDWLATRQQAIADAMGGEEGMEAASASEPAPA